MRRYIGVVGILTFLYESNNKIYVEELLDICIDELNLIVDKFLFTDDKMAGTTFIQGRSQTCINAIISTGLDNQELDAHIYRLVIKFGLVSDRFPDYEERILGHIWKLSLKIAEEMKEKGT